jgi:hypothetical protein
MAMMSCNNNKVSKKGNKSNPVVAEAMMTTTTKATADTNGSS